MVTIVKGKLIIGPIVALFGALMLLIAGIIGITHPLTQLAILLGYIEVYLRFILAIILGIIAILGVLLALTGRKGGNYTAIIVGVISILNMFVPLFAVSFAYIDPYMILIGGFLGIENIITQNKSKIQKRFKDSTSFLRSWFGTFTGGLTLICVIGLFLFPLITQNPYYIGIIVVASIFSIFAASWNFLAGFAGQVSFGHAIFLGIGGYITAIFVHSRFLNAHWIPSLLYGAIIATLVGSVVGIPSLRLKGPYLALGTLSLSVFILHLFINEQLAFIFFGEPGIDRVPTISTNPLERYYFHLVIMLVVIIILILIGRSRLGTIFRSIRDDATGSEASGISITKYKIIAFMISGFFGGIAGGLFAMYFRNTSPFMFQPLYSFYAIIMTAIGGIAAISGSALGAFIFFILNAILIDLWDPVFIFSVILILIIRFADMGLLRPALERLKDLYDFLLGR